jgi:peptidoglycan/xylan/chitin deacetylase (PgdA/CDA1 family)
MLIKAALSYVSPTGPEARLSILIFHRVLPQPDPLLHSDPDVQRFDQLVDWITHWFNVLPLGEAIERLKHGQLPARALSITFDDGYADNLLHAVPILLKHKAHATFFITTGYVDGRLMWNDVIIESVRSAQAPLIDLSFLGLGSVAATTIDDKRRVIAQAIASIMHLSQPEIADAVGRICENCAGTLPRNLMMTPSQLREMAGKGMALGAHTISHPILTRLSDNDVTREIADSRDFLSGLTGAPIELFAYPNGKLGRDYYPKHAQIVRDLGFSAALTTNWGVSGMASDLFQLPRFTAWDRGKLMHGLRLLSNYYQTTEYPR